MPLASVKGWETVPFLLDLGAGLSRGHSESPELALTMPSSPIPLSSHGCREHWLMSSPGPVWEQEGWAEDTARVSTPAIRVSTPLSLPHSQARLAGSGHGSHTHREVPDLPELSLPRALPWQEAILKKNGKRKGSLGRAQEKILPLCCSWGQAKGANISWFRRPDPGWNRFENELLPHCFLLSRLSKAKQHKQSHMVASLTFLKRSFLFQGLCRLYFILPKKVRAWSEAGKK